MGLTNFKAGNISVFKGELFLGNQGSGGNQGTESSKTRNAQGLQTRGHQLILHPGPTVPPPPAGGGNSEEHWAVWDRTHPIGYKRSLKGAVDSNKRQLPQGSLQASSSPSPRHSGTQERKLHSVAEYSRT